MRQISVISRHPISTGFRRLTGCQPDPRDTGVTPLTLHIYNDFDFVRRDYFKICEKTINC